MPLNLPPAPPIDIPESKTEDPPTPVDTTPAASPDARADELIGATTSGLKGWQQYWTQIKAIAKKTKNDPVELLAVSITYLGIDPNGLTTAPLAIVRQLATSMRQSVRKYGTLDEWWTREIKNRADAGEISAPAIDTLPSLYVGTYQPERPSLPRPPKPPKTPEERAADRAATEGAYQDLTNPVVRVDKNGNVVKKGGAELTLFGQQVRLSDFQQMRKSYDDVWLYYTGKRITDSELVSVISSGISDYQLTLGLTGRKDFYRSPAWKQHSGTYAAAADEILGEGKKLPREYVRAAIVNNWDVATFQSKLRKSDLYVDGKEFKTSEAAFTNIFSAVYGGQPDDEARTNIREAAKARWTPDQWAAYLRSLPGYQGSTEFQQKAIDFGNQLGSIFGGSMIDNTTGVTAGDPDPTAAPPPDTKVIAGSPTKPREATPSPTSEPTGTPGTTPSGELPPPVPKRRRSS